MFSNNSPLRAESLDSKRNVFSQEHLNSSDGMLVTIWGPPTWLFLHTLSFNYPVNPTNDDKKNYMSFIKNLQHVLPCRYCRINLEKNFKSLPLTMQVMESRDTFSRYIYNLHEKINTMLNKKSGLTYEEVRDKYEWFRARCRQKTKKRNLKNDKKHTLKKHAVKKHKGCTEPFYGKKGKCIMKIVPQGHKSKTLDITNSIMK